VCRLTDMAVPGIRRELHRHRLTVRDLGELPPAETTRGTTTGLINEPALLAMTASLNHHIGKALRNKRFPIVYGGDCAALLGIVAGLRDHAGSVGLVFVDGHEDTMPLDVSEDGEAANTELGLLLGLTGRLMTGPLAEALPALRPDLVSVLGPRDEEWRRRFNVGSLANAGSGSRRWPPYRRIQRPVPSPPYGISQLEPTAGGCMWTSTSSTRWNSVRRVCPVLQTIPADSAGPNSPPR
jgi:hypothetical protein